MRAVILLDERIDLVNQFIDAPERATTNRLLGDKAKPALNLIQPGRIRWCVVNVKTAALRQPGTNLGMFVRGVIVDNEVDVEIFRDTGVQAPQECEKLLMAVARLAFGEDSTRGDIECRE